MTCDDSVPNNGRIYHEIGGDDATMPPFTRVHTGLIV